MQTIVSERLSRMLRFWKDVCWSCEMLAHTTVPGADIEATLRDVMPPAVSRYETFERLVYDQTVQKLTLSDWLPTRKQNETFVKLQSFRMFPLEFFEWSRKSRRSFELPAGLSRVFGLATYPKMDWSDVILPYDSFAIVLEEPLRVEEQEDIWLEYDTILVTKLPLLGHIQMRLINKPVVAEDEDHVPDNVKRRIRMFIERGETEKAERWVTTEFETVEKRIVVTPGWRTTVLFSDADIETKTSVALEVADFAARPEFHLRANELEGGIEGNLWRLEPFSIAAKIVVGWCMYMDSLTSTDIAWREKRRKKVVRGSRGVTGVITEIDHICTVLGKARLDASVYSGTEVSQNASSGFFKRPHWRRRHKKRPPGTPPGSPKTVRVPTLLIRPDLVPFFGIIGGTHTKIVDDDFEDAMQFQERVTSS